MERAAERMPGYLVPDYEVTEFVDFDNDGEAAGFARRMVLVIEDHEIVRAGIRRLLEELSPQGLGGLIILDTSSLAEAKLIVANCRNHLDLILLDIGLPDAGVMEEMHILREDWSGLPVAVVSASEDWALAAAFIKLGVLGYIPKRCSSRTMRAALAMIFSGGRYLPDEVLLELGIGAPQLSGPADGNCSSVVNQGFGVLTGRESEVLSLVLDGSQNKEIAKKLNMSVGTAKNHVASVMRKFGVPNRLMLMRIGRQFLEKSVAPGNG